MNIIASLIRELIEREGFYGLVASTIGHFYYVRPLERDTGKLLNYKLTLTLPTRLQKEKTQVFVGDFVEISPDEQTIKALVPRQSFLQKPNASNLDRAVIVTATTQPSPEKEYLDRLLALSGLALPQMPLLCITKTDLKADLLFFERYKNLGYEMIALSNRIGEGIEELKALIEGQGIVLAGRSGVGKSSILKQLSPELEVKIGAVSHKNTQGTHTTRHSSLIQLEVKATEKLTFVLDTPGFSRLDLKVTPEGLIDERAFPEIALSKGKCQYPGCRHRGENGCMINFSQDRYKTYLKMLEEAESFAGEKLELRKFKAEKHIPKQDSQVKIPLLKEKLRDSSRKTKRQKFQQEVTDE
ncbi:MAG: ribosome small subunit-dependent GTPase A [Candidatus Caenarcaniphilales bacterium]|nr:ribosome small subunit-dependent GTPase A [Candidatus Caenarcaniphilales bacterium]